MKHKCPICEKYDFPEEDSFDICPICGWEDDDLQLKNPDYKGGANDMSLNEYRENWIAGKAVH